MDKIKIISIEGNIGAGKSTILNYLKEHYANHELITFVEEPVDMWGDIKGDDNEDILTKFYKNPKEYAFSFQVMAFATRVHKFRTALKNKPSARIFICERSLEADSNIFAKMLYDDGNMESINYKIYLQYYNIYKNEFQHKGIIFINTNPDKCLQRIKQRDRDGEDKIQIDYLRKCHDYHVKWLTGTPIEQSVLHVDGNIDSPQEIIYHSKDSIEDIIKLYS